MEYDSTNRLIKYNGQNVKYDADGNMTFGPLNGEMTTFVYDCRNRLIQAGDTTYQYDAENYRIGMTKNTGSDNEVQITYVVDSGSGDLSQVLKSVETDKVSNSKVLYFYYGANQLVGKLPICRNIVSIECTKLLNVWVNEIKNNNTDLEVTIIPIESHMKRSIIKIHQRVYYDISCLVDGNTEQEQPPIDQGTVEDPISMTTGGFVEENCVMNIAGVREVPFYLNYDSTQSSQNGDLGYGWYHNYESRVVDYGNLAEVWIDPITKLVFENQDSLENRIEGQYYNGTIYLGGYKGDSTETTAQLNAQATSIIVSDNSISNNSVSVNSIEATE